MGSTAETMDALRNLARQINEKTQILKDLVWDELQQKDFWDRVKKARFVASKRAMDIGTMVHKWVEHDFKGIQQDLPVNAEARNAVQNYLKWKSEHKVDVLDTEFKIYNDYLSLKYAGTCDLDAKIDGQRCIVDVKTAARIYEEAWLQTAAYQSARADELGISYKGRWILLFPKVGGFEAEFKPNTTFQEDWDGFYGALLLWNRLRRKK